MFFYKHLNFKWSFGLNAAWIETATTARLSLLALSAIIYYSVSGGPYGAEVWTRGFGSKYLQGMNHESWTVCIQYISWMVGDYSRYLFIWWLVVLIQLYNLIQHIRLLFDITYVIRQFFSMSTSASPPSWKPPASPQAPGRGGICWTLAVPGRWSVVNWLTLFNKKVVQIHPWRLPIIPWRFVWFWSFSFLSMGDL